MSDTYNKRKYLMVLHEAGDDTAYVGKALYLVSSDKNGGWNDLQTRLSLGNLRFKGETAPKKDSQLLEKLRWKQSEIKNNGFDCEVPSCITFSTFIEEMVTAGLIPSQPTTSNATEPIVPANPEEEEVLSSVQNLFDNQLDAGAIAEVEAAMIVGDDILDLDNTGHVGETVSKEAYDALKQKHDTAVEKVLVLENKNAEGQTDQASIIARSVKGFIDSSLKTFSSSIQNSVRREVRSAVVDLGTDHLSGIHEKIATLDHEVVSNGRGIEAVASTQENHQASLDTLVQDTKYLKAKINTVSTPIKAVVAKPSVASASGASGENWRSNPPPPVTRRCNFCNMVGHEWRNCRNRPTNYRCSRCLSPEHKEAACQASKAPCDQCFVSGHTKAIHALTDPQKRIEAILKFGPESFRHWSTEEDTGSASAAKRGRFQ